MKNKKGCRHIYEQITKCVNHESDRHWSQLKWHRNLNIELNNKHWSSVYSLPILCTIEMKLRQFQYKILNHILYPKSVLLKMKLVQSNKCDFCDCIETTIHMFCECEHIKQLWISLEKWLQECRIPSQDFSFKDIILGIPSETRLINHLILIMKYFIYKNNLNKTKGVFNQFLSNVKLYQDIEYNIANKNHKLDHFNGKWASTIQNLKLFVTRLTSSGFIYITLVN